MAACVRSRLNSASSELSLGRLEATFSDCERCSSSRMVESRSPRSCRISAAKHFSSRSRPSSRCSVPMCLWFSRSASSAPYASTRLHSWLSGRSTEVETFSRIVVWPSICLRMESTAACDRRNRLASCFVFPQQAEQQMLGLDIRAAELAGLIPREEDNPPRFFRITFKHDT